MSNISREIKYKLDETVEMLLRGTAADYPAYASLVARYRVLRELDDFLKEQKTDDLEGDDHTDVKE